MSDHLYFGNFDLPSDLVENICFTFFDIGEAHRVLTVSRAFRGLFARRVWRKLDSRVITLSEPTRSIAIAQYGHLVRYIDFDEQVCSAIKPDGKNNFSINDILWGFSDITTLRINLELYFHLPNGIQFKDIIMCFPKLNKLDIIIDSDREPHDLDTLAQAFKNRQSNRSMDPIQLLNLRYDVSSVDNPWTRLTSFVQMDLGNCAMKIDISHSSTAAVLPSQSEIHILRKHFVEPPDIREHEDAQFCYANINRSLFWRPLDIYSSCAYPLLRVLLIRTCCASPFAYDYYDITPSNFPNLQSINIKGHECSHMESPLYPPAWSRVLLQLWPFLNELTLSVKLIYDQLEAISDYHRRLTTLSIHLHPKMLDENNAFNLAMVIPLLPMLQRLSILGNNEMRLDYNPGYNDYESITRSQIKYSSFFGLSLSTRIFKLLYSLPKLDSVSILGCKFYSTGIGEIVNIDNLIGNPNEIDTIYDEEDEEDEEDGLYGEILETINEISLRLWLHNPCNINEFSLRIKEDDNDWPLDITLEMIALMPKLRLLKFDGGTDDIPRAVKARFPHIKPSITIT